MTRWTIRLAGLLVAGFSAACLAQQPVVVGAVVSQSGALADLAEGYRQALLLWQDEVNAAGGLLGRPVELRMPDDASDALRTGKQYERLVQEEKVDLLIGPFGSAATLTGAAVAERARRVFINGSGPAGAVQRAGTRYVFQTTPAYGSYGIGVAAVAAELGVGSLAILARDDPASVEMAQGAGRAAASAGIQVGDIELYRPAADDFVPQAGRAVEAQVEGWVGFGGPRDAAEMVKSLKLVGYVPKLFFARATADPAFIKLVGQDAEFSLGVLEYHPSFRTAGNERFAKAFLAKWGSLPGTAAAQGYAAAQVLAEAVRRAGELDQDKLREALAALELETVLGPYKVDPQNGAQIGIRPAVVQILAGRPQPVWPKALATVDSVAPFAPWSERPLYK